MARQRGPLKIQGTIDDLTFLRTQEGFRVRLKGGVSRDRVLKDPAFERTRENMAEFAECAKIAKQFRQASSSMISLAKDKHMSSRLTGVFAKIKNYDTTSPRGERKVAIGATVPGVLELLKNFDFNKRSSMSNILKAVVELNETTGVVTIVDLKPKTNLLAPTFATHFSLSSAFMKFDFATGAFEMQQSNSVNLPIDLSATTVTLTPANVPAGTGVAVHLLLIEFFQTISNQQYPLKSGVFNALSIIKAI